MGFQHMNKTNSIFNNSLSFQEMTLDSVMDYLPCPCKSINLDDPMAAMVVSMKTDGAQDQFNGVFNMRVDSTTGETGKQQIMEQIHFTVPVPTFHFHSALNMNTFP